MDRSNAPRRSFVLHLALALVLGLALAGLTQCRAVNDNVTGVDLRTGATLSARSSCTHDCNHRFKEAQKKENDAFKSALKKCGSDAECRKAAQVQHRDNAKKINDQKKACKSNCYNEGSGKGGS